MIVKGVSIGDIHFGIKDTARLYKELSLFKNYLKDNDIQLLVFNGDYFDKKLSIGDPESYYAFIFFKEILDIIKEKKIICRMIQGTRSHDLNQLQVFKPYENDTDIDFKIYEEVTEENILGADILFIPEEYPENSEEYYKYYKEKKYHMCFVHGTFDFVAQPGVIENSNRSTHSAPVFFWNDWKDVFENGFVSAGHIHGRNTYKKKIFYPGSYSRWNYGERSDKGFTSFEYNLDELSYSVEYIDNTLAPKFDVVSVSSIENVQSLNTDEIKTQLDLLLESTDNLRIDLSGLTDDKLKVLKEYYKNNQNVKIEVRERKSQLKETKKESTNKKWEYIVKRTLPIEETVRKYCKEEFNKDIPISVISKALEGEKDENEG